MNNKTLTVLLIAVSLVAVFAVYQSLQLKSEVTELKKKQTAITVDSSQTKQNPTVNKEFELVTIMGRMQVYANKLWYAGDADNWDLAGFYVEEIEESMEEIEHADIEENGVKLSEAVKEWGLNPLKNMESAVEKKDKNQFLLEYDNLTINCSGCHTVTQHPYIKIIRPTAPVFTNQKYSVK